MNNQAVIYAFVSGLPVAALLMFFITHFIRSRTGFEVEAHKQFADVKFSLANLDKRIELMAKDLEHVATLSPVLTDLVERVGKLKLDLDNSFKRIRDLEGTA